MMMMMMMMMAAAATRDSLKGTKPPRFVRTLYGTTSSTEKVVLGFRWSADTDSVAGLYKYFQMQHDWHDRLIWMRDET
jgi:hypothetical protein